MDEVGERRAAEVGPACGELRFVFPHLLPDESLNGLGLWRESVDEIAVGLEVRHVHQASAHAFANDGLPLQRQVDVGLRHTHAVGRGIEHEHTVAAYVGDAEVGLAVVVSAKDDVEARHHSCHLQRGVFKHPSAGVLISYAAVEEPDDDVGVFLVAHFRQPAAGRFNEVVEAQPRP